MYALINNFLGIPTGTTNVNSTVTYVAGVIALLLVVVFIDLFYKLIRALFNRSKFD